MNTMLSFYNDDKMEELEFFYIAFKTVDNMMNTIGEALAVRTGNPKNIHSYEDIAKNPEIKVTVMNGAIEMDYLKAAGVKESQMEIVTDIPSSITSLESNRVDAITMTGPTLNAALSTGKSKNIEVVKDFTQPVVDGKGF